MLTLKTGLPRNGKTVSLVTELAALLDLWKKNPAQSRPVFQFGITGLTLPATLIEAWPVSGKQGDVIPLSADGKPTVALTFDQGGIPDGALVLIDEAQDFYPPRGPSQQPPAHVRALNTHGHRDIDYVLCTQHPKLLDNAVRRLVNKHQHYRRAMGGGSAITYEWDVCSDSLEYQKAIKGVFSYPKKSFQLYRSASGFTKPKFKLPAFLIIPALALPLAIWALPTAWAAISGAMSGKGVASPVQVAPAGKVPSLAFGALPAASSPVPSPVPLPVAAVVAPVAMQGCIASAAKCMCIDSAGLVAVMTEAVCREASAVLGGVVPYDVSPPQSARPKPAALTSAVLNQV